MQKMVGGKMRHFPAIPPQEVVQIPSSPLTNFLFCHYRISWLWCILRLYLGYKWLTSGWEKLTGYSIALGSFGEPARGGAWVFSNHQMLALHNFVANALKQAVGPHPNVQHWYAVFLQSIVLPHAGVFAYLVTFGEVLVGLGLLFGAFTGIAAFFGAFLNMNYLLAGSISINPEMCILSLLLLLAWRIGGFYGLDRYLLPLLGTPWTRQLTLFHKEACLPKHRQDVLLRP
jgi:thiosulfate dehydrogenase [quinone] large subunit